MTSLQPVYARAKVEVPHPTRAKSLNAFPFDMSRPSVTDATLDSAQQILAKVCSCCGSLIVVVIVVVAVVVVVVVVGLAGGQDLGNGVVKPLALIMAVLHLWSYDDDMMTMIRCRISMYLIE